MSWFFGKKKHHKDSPPETPNNEQSSAGQADDFIFIEKRSNPLPSNTDDNESQGNMNGRLYPSIGGIPPYPETSQHYLPKQSHQTDFQSILNGIPFKLCSELNRNINNDLDIDNLRINEILFFIERIQNTNYDYDFNVERSVISEMNSQSDE